MFYKNTDAEIRDILETNSQLRFWNDIYFFS